MAKTDITVFIPVYNGARFIAEAIRSVLGQSHRDLYVCVSDNCSTDSTRQIVRGFLADGRIQLIEQPQNLGMAGNLNACLQLAQTKYYMMLFHDDYLLDSHALSKAYQALEANPGAVSVYSDLLFVDARGRRIAPRRFKRSGLMDPRLIAKQCILATRNLFGIALLNRSSAIGDARYDPEVPYVLDVDMSIAMSKGAQVLYIPELLIANRFHIANSTFGLLGNVRREDLRIAAKHGIPLTWQDLLRMRLNSWVATAQKRAFHLWIRYKDREPRAGSA